MSGSLTNGKIIDGGDALYQLERQSMRTLRIKQVLTMTGLSRSSIYLYMGQGSFPKSFKIGVRAIGWLEEDVVNWISQKQLSSGV